MLLFCYLRRALECLRSGIRGPVLFPAALKRLNIAPKAIRRIHHVAAFVLRVSIGLVLDSCMDFLRNGHNVIKILHDPREIVRKKLAFQIHLAILQARSGKRNGPFVPAHAGGNI